ncbi:MAG: hypothetical protein IJR44_06695, partial [Neisseriaceae bacterium]|nr:hypothetical protein [Neisseriaceae bacterium]
MNKIYRTVYNETTNTWVAVEETAKSHRKSSGGVVDSTPTSACERVSGSLKLRGLTAAVAIALFSPLAVSPAFADDGHNWNLWINSAAEGVTAEGDPKDLRGNADVQAVVDKDKQGAMAIQAAQTYDVGGFSWQTGVSNAKWATAWGSGSAGSTPISAFKNQLLDQADYLEVDGLNTRQLKSAINNATSIDDIKAIFDGKKIDIYDDSDNIVATYNDADGIFNHFKFKEFGVGGKGEYATAWGKETVAGNNQATAFGENSIANGVNSTAFGKDSYAYADNSLAALGGKVGSINTADATHYEDPNNDGVGLNSVAIGDGAWVQSDNSVAMGQNSVVGKDADKSLAMIGGQVSKNATGAIAMGNNAQAQSPHSVSIGTNAVTMNRTGTIAIGAGNPNLAGNGHNTSGALAGNVGAIAIGRKAEAVNATLNVLYDTDGYAYVPETIGTETLTNNVGESFNRDYSYSRTIAPDNSNIMQMVAIGEDVSAYADQAIAIGSNTIAAGNASIAMVCDDVGRDCRPAKEHFQDVQNELKDLQTELTNNGYQVPVTLKNTTSNADAFKDRTLALGDVSMALGMKAVSQGDLSNAIGMGARTIGANSNAIGTVAFAGAENSVALGSVAMTNEQAEKSVAVGYMAQTGGEIALGDIVSLQIDPNDKTKGTKKFSVNGEEEQELSELGSVKIDDKGVEHKGVYTGTGENSVAVGEHNKVLGNNSTAVGQGNIIIGNNSGAFGDPNVIIGNDSKALGNNNVVAGHHAFVMGNNVTNTAHNSIFLGTGSSYTKAKDDLTVDDAGSTAGMSNVTFNDDGSIASIDESSKYETNAKDIKVLEFDADGNVVLVDDGKGGKTQKTSDTVAIKAGNLKFAGANAAGVVSVGDVGAERRIQNVAAGLIDKDSTDAINGSQLFSVIQNLKPETTPVTPENGIATYTVENYFDKDGNPLTKNEDGTYNNADGSQYTGDANDITTINNSNKFVTAGDVVNTINNVYWSVDGQGNGDNDEVAHNVKAGNKVDLIGGDGVSIDQVRVN